MRLWLGRLFGSEGDVSETCYLVWLSQWTGHLGLWAQPFVFWIQVLPVWLISLLGEDMWLGSIVINVSLWEGVVPLALKWWCAPFSRYHSWTPQYWTIFNHFAIFLFLGKVVETVVGTQLSALDEADYLDRFWFRFRTGHSTPTTLVTCPLNSSGWRWWTLLGPLMSQQLSILSTMVSFWTNLGSWD